MGDARLGRRAAGPRTRGRQTPRGEDILVKALTDLAADDEVKRFLKANAGIESVEYLITDTNGVLRGKWAPPQSLAKAATSGVALPMSVFGLDVWGREVTESGLHLESGDRDGICRLVPGSVAPVPWARRPTAQAIVTMHDDHGLPFTGDPRQQLAAAVERLQKLAFAPSPPSNWNSICSIRRPATAGRRCSPVTPGRTARTPIRSPISPPTAPSSPTCAPSRRRKACRSTRSCRKPPPASSR